MNLLRCVYCCLDRLQGCSNIGAQKLNGGDANGGNKRSQNAILKQGHALPVPAERFNFSAEEMSHSNPHWVYD